jgi:regulator of replication initiation timing
MEEIQLDGQTLLSVYQSKVSSLVNENIMLEAKNLILTTKLTELSNKVSELEKPTSRKKAVNTVKDAGAY